MQAGDCFIALKGENQDGHQFIEKAIALGATGIICEDSYKINPQLSSISWFTCRDTLSGYRQIAKIWRQQFKIPVFAIAGSAGKTTSKEFCAAILRGKYKNVLQTVASQNGFQGIPATIMNLTPSHEAAVIEVGIDEPHAMEDHLQIVSPDYGLLSSIGEEHLEKLIDIQTVAHEEGLLFKHLADRDACMAVLADDPLVVAQAEKYSGGLKYFYGLKETQEGAHFIRGKLLDSTLEVKWNSQSFTFHLPLPGEHNARNLLGAISLALAHGLSAEEIKSGLQTFKPPSGRSEVYSWKNNVKVFCDTYNANPLSMKIALQLLQKNANGPRHTWACLGDMLELGTNEEGLHRQIADQIADLKIDFVLACGPRMKFLIDELKQRNFGGFCAHFSDPMAMTSKIISDAQASDTILIKGSRGMKMERLWEELKSRA